MPNITCLVNKTNFNVKVTKIEYKMANVADFVKKTNFGRKISTAVTNLATKKTCQLLLII